MDSANSELPTLPGNRLIAYIQSLAKAKKGLPYGIPVCVSVSHTITTTDGLLRFASLVGPYIAVLQLYADIIDDWSEDTVLRLTSLAKKHGFLIWESGRILNATADIVGRLNAMSREVRNELVDLVRKKYTRGLVKPASWANLSTAWASGVPVNNQEGDILIPTLKTAAREAVADIAQTIRTEITVGHSGHNSESFIDRSFNTPEPSSAEDESFHYQMNFEYAVKDGNHSNTLNLPPRKASTISLTQTITQHTEDSSAATTKIDYNTEVTWNYGVATPPAIDTDLPPTPLLARGLVLGLPCATDSCFTLEYRKTSIAAACANLDFVLGFICGEPWHVVSQRDDSIFDLDALNKARSEQQEEQEQQSPYRLDEDDEAPLQSIAMFSVIPPKFGLVDDQPIDGTSTDHTTFSPSSPPLDSLNPLASKLYLMVGRAMKLRDASARGNEASPETKTSRRRFNILHIPVVSLP